MVTLFKICENRPLVKKYSLNLCKLLDFVNGVLTAQLARAPGDISDRFGVFLYTFQFTNGALSVTL